MAAHKAPRTALLMLAFCDRNLEGTQKSPMEFEIPAGHQGLPAGLLLATSGLPAGLLLATSAALGSSGAPPPCAAPAGGRLRGRLRDRGGQPGAPGAAPYRAARGALGSGAAGAEQASRCVRALRDASPDAATPGLSPEEGPCLLRVRTPTDVDRGISASWKGAPRQRRLRSGGPGLRACRAPAARARMAAEGQPTRPPTNIEDFLWNLHSVLVATPAPLALDSLKDAYSKHLGHKFIIERFLVVGDGGLAATLKRIPHMVTLFTSEAGVLCVRATQAADTTRQKLLEADSAYRRELIKKNAAAKAKAGAAKAGLAAPKAAAPAAAPPAAAEQAPKAAAPPAAAVGDKRQPDGGDPEAKKQRTGSDEETLAKMLVQGVVRVLQNRVKTGKGPLPLSQLEDEFKQQWKLPFNPQQAGERDAVSFLQKWPNKVEVFHDGTQQIVQLAKNKPKASGTPEDVAANKAGDGATAKGGAAAAPAAVKAPAAKALTPAAAAPPAKGPPPAKGAPPAQAAATNGPTRPPASVEDFLWNVHTVIDAHGGPMPVDQLKDAYSSRLGHKCAIERFLVVGEGGLAATLKRIPHVVTLDQ
ncbi:unnamed protein product, partial [Prorocentrum cordatum]